MDQSHSIESEREREIGGREFVMERKKKEFSLTRSTRWLLLSLCSHLLTNMQVWRTNEGTKKGKRMRMRKLSEGKKRNERKSESFFFGISRRWSSKRDDFVKKLLYQKISSFFLTLSFSDFSPRILQLWLLFMSYILDFFFASPSLSLSYPSSHFFLFLSPPLTLCSPGTWWWANLLLSSLLFISFKATKNKTNMFNCYISFCYKISNSVRVQPFWTMSPVSSVMGKKTFLGLPSSWEIWIGSETRLAKNGNWMELKFRHVLLDCYVRRMKRMKRRMEV